MPRNGECSLHAGAYANSKKRDPAVAAEELKTRQHNIDLPKLPPRTQPLHTSDTLDDVIIPPSTRSPTATPRSKCAAGRARICRIQSGNMWTREHLQHVSNKHKTCIDGIRLKSRCACLFLCTRPSFHGFQR